MLIGAPPEKAFEEADSLFRDKRYLDLTQKGSVKKLAEEIRRRRPVSESQPRETPEQVLSASQTVPTTATTVNDAVDRSAPPALNSPSLTPTKISGPTTPSADVDLTQKGSEKKLARRRRPVPAKKHTES